MRGINKLMLIGNAGNDLEFKTLQDGTPVARLTIATTESYRLKTGNTNQNRIAYNNSMEGLASFASVKIS